MPIQRTVCTVAYSDGRVEEYRVTPRVEITFERVAKVGMANAFNGSEGSTNVYRLAWHAAKAAAGDSVIPDFEKWVDTVEAVDMGKENVTPFVAGQQPGESPTLQSPPG